MFLQLSLIFKVVTGIASSFSNGYHVYSVQCSPSTKGGHESLFLLLRKPALNLNNEEMSVDSKDDTICKWEMSFEINQQKNLSSQRLSLFEIPLLTWHHHGYSWICLFCCCIYFNMSRTVRKFPRETSLQRNWESFIEDSTGVFYIWYLRNELPLVSRCCNRNPFRTGLLWKKNFLQNIPSHPSTAVFFQSLLTSHAETDRSHMRWLHSNSQDDGSTLFLLIIVFCLKYSPASFSCYGKIWGNTKLIFFSSIHSLLIPNLVSSVKKKWKRRNDWFRFIVKISGNE
jgi:hypothetical protein